MKKINFTACEYLDFSDNYAAKKELISIFNKTKVCWDRPVIDDSYPRLVQFCKKRGRLNSPECCLSYENKQCNDYNEKRHSVEIEIDK